MAGSAGAFTSEVQPSNILLQLFILTLFIGSAGTFFRDVQPLNIDQYAPSSTLVAGLEHSAVAVLGQIHCGKNRCVHEGGTAVEHVRVALYIQNGCRQCRGVDQRGAALEHTFVGAYIRYSRNRRGGGQRSTAVEGIHERVFRHGVEVDYKIRCVLNCSIF